MYSQEYLNSPKKVRPDKDPLTVPKAAQEMQTTALVQKPCVFETEDGLYDVQYCSIIDKAGKITIGHGPGFRYPDAVREKVENGWTVGDAFNTMYEWERKGMGGGAIGCLTKGVVTRTQLSEQAVIAALVPRIKREMFPEIQAADADWISSFLILLTGNMNLLT